MKHELDDVHIDWSDFAEAGRRTRQLVRRLAADKTALRNMVYAVEHDEQLFSKCETHQLLDYIVIYDALDRGLRLRVHISTDDHFDRPHDHRFSFSSLIVRGQYRHTWHVMHRPVYDAGRDDRVRLWQNRRNPDPESDIEFDDLQPVFTRVEAAGNCYTLHHSAIHTTFTMPDTVSIFLRGPSEKRRSIIMDRAERTFWWRFGRTEETDERRHEKQMTVEKYRDLRSRLERLGVI